MKLDLFGLPQGGAGYQPEAIIVDSFAGGGGASTGIEMALGRSPDIAINHNADALAMHEVNHPATLHLSKNIWQVDPIEAVGRRRVGLAWFSPDCKHFSKAKGGRPVKRAIRDLAWVVVLWARRVRPEIIMLENVEEFRDWGPVTAEGKPCPDRKGQTFAQWSGELKRLGYRMEWRELRACDYGAPTIRKRFFMIARRDGRPIVWPERTHGNPNKAEDVALIAAGKLRPWRTAAEIIDWGLPCPSIFETSAEILERHGVRAVRPLADATMRRIARGVVRYVLEAKKPFVVGLAHGDSGSRRHYSIDEPLTTVHAGGKNHAVVVPSFVGCGGRAVSVISPLEGEMPGRAEGGVAEREAGDAAADRDAFRPTIPPSGLPPISPSRREITLSAAAPFVSYAQQGGVNRAADEPLHTITASQKDQNAVVVPVLATLNHGGGRDHAPKSVEDPFRTVTAARDAHALVAPYLVPRYMEREGQNPRTRSVEEPTATVVPGGNEGVLAAVHLSRFTQHGVGSGVDEPVDTIMAGATKFGVVAAFLAQHNSGNDGHDARTPVSTLTAGGQGGVSQQGVVAAHLSWAYTSNTRGGEGDLRKPTKTIVAGGNHAALIAPFLTKYYGTGDGAEIGDPLHTDTTKDRFGLVTVEIDGQSYAIADIGMRMLTPRERFRAQGFPDSYIIDRRPDGSPITATVQGSCCGNSVCPPLAEALVRANCGHLARVREAAE